MGISWNACKSAVKIIAVMRLYGTPAVESNGHVNDTVDLGNVYVTRVFVVENGSACIAENATNN